MEPVAARISGERSQALQQLGRYPLSLKVWVNYGVENKGVSSAIPARVNEAAEPGTIERADPAHTVGAQLLRPRSDFGARCSAEREAVQLAQLNIIDRPTLHVGDAHQVTPLDGLRSQAERIHATSVRCDELGEHGLDPSLV